MKGKLFILYLKKTLLLLSENQKFLLIYNE